MSQSRLISPEKTGEPLPHRRRLAFVVGSMLFVGLLLFTVSGSLSAAGPSSATSAISANSGGGISASTVLTGEVVIEPTVVITVEATAEPTAAPVVEPTVEPTEEPVVEPTAEPTEELVVQPTAVPTEEPVFEPTIEPTIEPTVEPITATATPSTTVVAEPAAPITLTNKMHMPVMGSALTPPNIAGSRPNSTNNWTVSWNNVGATKYEIQESQTPDFSGAAIVDNGSAMTYPVSKAASPFNSYYYRVRSVGPNGKNSAWSNVIEVVGAYSDDFSNGSTNWDVRRTTYKEEVTSFYENPTDGWFILRVEDSWDWGIASPLAKAPTPPYVIEYRVQPANLGNLVSQGVVFGSDFPGATCDPISSITGFDNIYKHTNCFNKFYATNTIWYGKLKLQFERIDQLVWCGSCGGSPMKRIGDVFTASDPIPNVDPDGFNTWRIEVRNGEIKFFANGALYYTYNDTRHINNPYFGVFATTDEYSNSTARFDYFKITPLDN